MLTADANGRDSGFPRQDVTISPALFHNSKKVRRRK
jgi:hypothetical protein